MNWALALGIFGLTLFAWTRAKTYGWKRSGDIYFIVLMSISVFGGEVWYLTNNSIPWFFGAEAEMESRADFNPIVLLLILGIIGVWALRWPLSKLAQMLNNTGKLPPISAVALSGFFLLAGGYMAAVGGAYNTKMSGDQPGRWAVNAERAALAQAAGFVSKLLSSGAEIFPTGDGSSHSSNERNDWKNTSAQERQPAAPRHQEIDVPEENEQTGAQMASAQYQPKKNTSAQYYAANASPQPSRQHGPDNN
ncbi:MAG: hypothetical protein V1668_03855 [Patescibacteria group bacterium]